MRVRTAVSVDIEDWAGLRAALWPGDSVDLHRREIIAALSAASARSVAFVAEDAPDGVAGFVEASLRQDYVNGCETSPVAFVEGIYVRPNRRGGGMGRALIAAVETWARQRGCAELASDAPLANRPSHAFHAALGLQETERVVFFRKPL